MRVMGELVGNIATCNPTREKIYSQSRRYIMWEIGGKPKSIKFREWESDDAPYLPHATNDK